MWAVGGARVRLTVASCLQARASVSKVLTCLGSFVAASAKPGLQVASHGRAALALLGSPAMASMCMSKHMDGSIAGHCHTRKRRRLCLTQCKVQGMVVEKLLTAFNPPTVVVDSLPVQHGRLAVDGNLRGMWLSADTSWLWISCGCRRITRYNHFV